MRGHAEIVGAGFAGLAAARALAQAGWSVRVHERDPELRTAGSGIYIQSFAQQVLRHLGLFERVAAEAFEPRARDIYIDGEHRSVADVAGQFLGLRRSRYHAILIEGAQQAGVDFALGSPIAAVDPAGTITTATGRQLSADLVILADGVRSGLTQSLGIAVERRQHPDGIIRVLLDRHGMLGPEWDRIIDAYDYRTRPLRLLYSPCAPDGFYFCLMAPAGSARAGIPVDVALWSASFPMFARSLARIGSNGHYDRYSSIALSNWSVGRVAVVGDAAHVMPSTLGQGAGVSIMNAVALAHEVNATSTVPNALTRWETMTRPIVEAWQRRAEQVASQRHLSGARHPGEDFNLEKPEATPPLPYWLARQESLV